MRNTSEDRRAAWASYVHALRQATKISRPELARRLGIDPATVWRWETAKQKPESPDVPLQLARLFQLDPDDVLAAAGLRPTNDAAAQPELPAQERDPVIQWILDNPKFDEDEKLALVRRELARIDRERADRIAELEWLVRERDRREESLKRESLMRERDRRDLSLMYERDGDSDTESKDTA